MSAPSSQLERRWLRTPQAAEAIGVPTKLLNRWIERGVLAEFRLAGPNLWKTFSLRDLASLCLVPALTEHGFPLQSAGEWSHSVFKHVDLSRRPPEQSEAEFLLRAYRNWDFAVWLEGGLPRERLLTFDDAEPPHFAFVDAGPLPRHFGVIRAGQILADCLKRAGAMSERPYQGRPPSDARA